MGGGEGGEGLVLRLDTFLSHMCGSLPDRIISSCVEMGGRAGGYLVALVFAYLLVCLFAFRIFVRKWFFVFSAFVS